jgi:hypothetical protein
MGPLRSGILEMITVSVGPRGFGALLGVLLRFGALRERIGRKESYERKSEQRKAGKRHSAGRGPDKGVDHDCASRCNTLGPSSQEDADEPDGPRKSDKPWDQLAHGPR